MFSEYFIDRPRFAGVISIIMILLGLLAIAVLPVSQYPEITPPQIVVSTTYPGASAQVVIDTVAVPVENQINGVENMLYMTSSSNDDGSYKLTITFNIGTDPDIAQVKVQNRLNQVMSQLPEIVQQQGLEVNTQMSNMLALLALRSPQNTYDDLYLSNYAYANLKNPLSRVDGIGDVQIFGPQYSMRVWLKPVRVVFSITDKDYLEEAGRPEMFAGETLRLKLADGAVYPQTGTFGYVDNQIDKSTNSIAVYADFANPDKRLVANAYVNVLVEKKYRGMIVRKDLVYIEPDGSYIYVAGANGVVKTAVNILSEYGNNNYILKNTFTPGESIVLDKMGAGDEGHKFKIVMEGAAAAGEKN